MSEWQPITTAPLDTLARLVWCPERRNIYAVSWGRGYDGWGWMIFGGGTSMLRETPTHWMPLPAQPGDTP